MVALICGLLRSAALVNDDAMMRDGVIIKVHTSNQLTKLRRERALEEKREGESKTVTAEHTDECQAHLAGIRGPKRP